MIFVKFYGTLQSLLNVKEISLPFKNNLDIRELLLDLEEKIKVNFTEKLMDESDDIIPGTIILVNKKNIFHLEKLNTKLEDGDEVVIFPPGAGG